MQSIYLNYIMLLFLFLTLCFFLVISFCTFFGRYAILVVIVVTFLCVGMCVSVLCLSSHHSCMIHSFEYNFNAYEWNEYIEPFGYCLKIWVPSRWALIWLNKRVQIILMRLQNHLHFSCFIRSESIQWVWRNFICHISMHQTFVVAQSVACCTEWQIWIHENQIECVQIHSFVNTSGTSYHGIELTVCGIKSFILL